MIFLAGTAGVIDINGTAIVELVTFLIMLGILSRYVFPDLVRRAEARRQAIAAELKAADDTRAQAEARLKEAEAQLNEARKTAQGVIEGASKSAEQLRQELRQKAEEESRRMVESARKEIEAERDQALRSVRGEVAGLVVAATEKVIGETLDEKRHQRLIEQAITEVASGNGSR